MTDVGNPDGPNGSDEPNGGRGSVPVSGSARGRNESPSGLTRHPFIFSGSAGDYFGICIRTFLLAIVTLGIYDAWGKVERRRYLWGHTKLAGLGFDFHARPINILKARIIVVVILIAFQIATSYVPLLVFASIPLLFVLTPWLVILSTRFNARNTSYRNVRFDFQGRYWPAFHVFVFLPILMLFTLGLLYPYMKIRQGRYIAENLYFGSAPFSCVATTEGIFRYWMYIMVLGLALIGASVMIGFAAFQADPGSPILDPEIQRIVTGGGLLVNGIYLVLFIAVIAFQAKIRNAIVNAVALRGGHRMESTVPAWEYLGTVVLTSLAATATLGLMIPWATVTLRAFLLKHTAFMAKDDLDTFAAHQQKPGSAFGEEFAGMEDVGGGVFDGLG